MIREILFIGVLILLIAIICFGIYSVFIISPHHDAEIKIKCETICNANNLSVLYSSGFSDSCTCFPGGELYQDNETKTFYFLR
jgi:hypothetical protein